MPTLWVINEGTQKRLPISAVRLAINLGRGPSWGPSGAWAWVPHGARWNAAWPRSSSAQNLPCRGSAAHRLLRGPVYAGVQAA